MKLPTGQFKTWLEHATLAVIIPSVFGSIVALLGDDGLFAAAIVSTFTLTVFVSRELRDVIRHRKDFDDLGNPDGVTWRADMWGDINGPLTAWLTYWFAYGLSVIS